MRRHSIGPANIFPPLTCERLEDRSVLSVAGLGAIGAADESAEAISCEETTDEAILSEEGESEVGEPDVLPVEEWTWDESWVTEDEFFDESWVPVEENFDESGVPVEENFDESGVPVEENFDESWVPVEENFDESWAPVEENFDESWAPDGADWIWQCGMTEPIRIPGASDDESIFFTTMAAGGIPVPASPEIAESAGPLVAAPNPVAEIAAADAALALPPESAPNKPFVVQELSAPQADPIVVPPPPAAIVPDQSAENSAGIAFSASATSDDHISSAESLELSEDLPVG